MINHRVFISKRVVIPWIYQPAFICDGQQKTLTLQQIKQDPPRRSFEGGKNHATTAETSATRWDTILLDPVRHIWRSFLKWGYPQKKKKTYTLNNVNMIFYYKPSILGYPHLWKYPYQQTSADRSRCLMNPSQAPGSTNGPPCFCHLDADG